MTPKPVQRARRLLQKYGYESPHEIDLIELLYAEGLYLKYETTDAYQGKIVYNNRTGIITINDNLENEYQKRYVIAHEMGHFFNERKGRREEKVKVEGANKVEEEVKHEFRGMIPGLSISAQVSKEGYSANKYAELIKEKEANQFAVELLMPGKWFKEKVNPAQKTAGQEGQKLKVKLLKEIAEEFRVSLTAAVLRFAELYNGGMVVILTKDKRIAWIVSNKNFSYNCLSKGELISLNTRTYDIYDKLMPTNYVENKIINRIGYREFIKMKNDYLASLDKTIIVNSSDWFSNDPNAEHEFLYQIDFPMMNYNSVLTILWEE